MQNAEDKDNEIESLQEEVEKVKAEKVESSTLHAKLHAKQEKQIESLKEQVEKVKAEYDETSALHAKEVFTNVAEDMFWKKKYRTLKAKHNRWVKQVKTSDLKLSTVQEDNLEALLAEAAKWDEAAREQEAREKEEASAAASKLLESRKSLEASRLRQAAANAVLQAAKDLEEEAAAREAAAVTREAAAIAREEAAVAREETTAAREAATVAREAAAGAREDDLNRQEAAVKLQQFISSRNSRKETPTMTNATPGSRAYSKWRQVQVEKIDSFLVNMFGDLWSQEFNNSKDKNNSSSIAARNTKPQDVVDVLSMFFKKYQSLFDVLGDPKRRGKNIAALAEKVTVDAMQEHLDNVVVALHTATNLTDKGYQALINYTSFVWNDDHLERFILPWGTPMARWMSKNALKSKLIAISKELGIEIKPSAAWLDPAAVLVKRIEELVDKGYLTLVPGMTVKSQILGDATTVWRSMNVNGTTIVMKVLYNDKNADGDKNTGDGVNCLQNQRAIGFYLGDDTLKELREHLAILSAQLAQIAEHGLTVTGVRINVRLLLGGDLKFLNSMLGLQNNAAMFPCPFCICHKDLLHLSLAQLIDIKKKYEDGLPLLKEQHLTRRRKLTKKEKVPPLVYLGPRSNDDQLKLAHIEATSCCPGHLCWKAVEPGTEEELTEGTAAWTEQCQLHFSTKPGLGLFSKSIALKDVLIDVLHIILRVVPAIYRATVTQHIDKTQCEDLSQWIFDTHGVIVSGSTAVQSATGKEGAIGNECWHGRVCDKILEIYEEIIDMVHEKGSKNHLANGTVWDAFWLFYEELVVNKCNDDDRDDINRHADKLQELAEDFVDKFIAVATGVKVTPYMHTMLADIPRLVREHGSLVKFSSQGVERLHQLVKFITQHRSNRQNKDVAGTVVKGLTLKSSQWQDQRKGKRHAINPVGGHMSKAARTSKEEKTAKRQDRLAL